MGKRRAEKNEKKQNRLLASQSERFIDRLSIQLAKVGEVAEIISPSGSMDTIVLAGHSDKEKALSAIENGCRLRSVLPRMVKY